MYRNKWHWIRFQRRRVFITSIRSNRSCSLFPEIHMWSCYWAAKQGQWRPFGHTEFDSKFTHQQISYLRISNCCICRKNFQKTGCMWRNVQLSIVRSRNWFIGVLIIFTLYNVYKMSCLTSHVNGIFCYV